MIYEKESFNIKGAIFEVKKHLGTGFLEKVYQEALAREFDLQGIPYEREKEIQVVYKGQPLEQKYYADFVCYDKIIIELKAIKQLEDVHRAQTINYLHATGYELGFLVNFGEKFVPIERFVNTRQD